MNEVGGRTMAGLENRLKVVGMEFILIFIVQLPWSDL